MVSSKATPKRTEMIFQETEPLVPLWKIEDVMTYLKVGRDRVYELVNEYGLPIVVLGAPGATDRKELHFYPFAVRDWVKEHIQTK